MILEVILTLIIIFLTHYYIKNVYNVKRQMNYFKQEYEKQGYKVLLIPYKYMKFTYLDQVHKYKDDLMYFDLNVVNKYDVVISVLMNKPLILIVNPGLLKEYFGQKDIWVKHNMIFNNILRLLGKGLTFTEGSYWKKKRQIFSKVFHFDFVVNLIPIMKECIQTEFEAFDAHHPEKQKKIKPLEELIKVTTRAVFKGFFGSNDKEIQQMNINGKSFQLNFLDLNNKVVLQSISPVGLLLGKRFLELGIRKQDREINQQIKLYRGIVQEFIKKRIESIKKQPKNESKKKNLLQTLHQAGILHDSQQIEEDKLNYKEFIDDFCTFLLAGGETVSVTATHLIVDIQQNPGVKVKVQQEINKYIKTNDDYTYENLVKLTYLDGVIRQTLRKKNSARLLAIRESLKQCSLGNVRIPAKTLLLVSLVGNSHNQAYFTDAVAYKPQRWATLKLENESVFAAVPFSAGQRNCIGQHFGMIELKMIIIEFLKRYNYEIKDQVKMVQKFALQSNNFEAIITRK